MNFCYRTLVFVLLFVGVSVSTPLDDYIALPDPVYRYKLNDTIQGTGWTIYNLRLVSQQWLTPQDSNGFTWEHWLSVCVPEVFKNPGVSTAFLYIDGGSDGDTSPGIDFLTEILCTSSSTVVGHLYQIPNQPVTFAEDPTNPRSEDAFIAFTWWHFFQNMSDPFWLARLPMTKSVVRAMDAIQSFVQSLPGVPDVETFVVGGASKRGWTTWTTGAVDKRVIAMVPIVMPILNMIPNMNHQFMAYGEWSFALDDYLHMGLMKFMNDPQFEQLAAIVDPYSYINRLTMPKFLVCSTGDEFFLPDSPSFFLSQMLGETHLRMVPNAEHSLAGHQIDVALEVETFYRMVINNQPRPDVQFVNQYYTNGTGLLVATTQVLPSRARLFVADTLSHTMRDFRLVTCWQLPQCVQLVPWFPTDLQPVKTSSGYVYSVFVDSPYAGWRGYMIQFDYSIDQPMEEYTFTKTTEVYVVPNTLPFPNCGQNCQPSI